MNLKEKNQESTKTKRSKFIVKKVEKQVKGITLIALVVTIIVLLILAGIALNLTVGQNGIFSRAQGAANTWRNAEANEQLALQEGADLIDQYLNGNGGSNNNQGTVEENPLKDITVNENENITTQDKYGNPITIPAGFKVVNPEDDVTKGIIIEDVSAPGKTSYTQGSQFVWIPVGDVYTSAEHTEANKKTITLGRYTFDYYSNGQEHLVESLDNWNGNTSGIIIEDYYMELANSEYGNSTAKNLKEFLTEANTSHGYYIGRYEAGDATAKNSERVGKKFESKPNSPITCKSGVYPYTYVNQNDASELCKTMYFSNNFQSDLINSYAWDTAIVFIQTFSEDTNYSVQDGKNTQSSLLRCGESILYYVNSGDEAHDVRCNIFDMAGNAEEFTTETSNQIGSTNNAYVARGGSYYPGTETKFRESLMISYSDQYYSFRPILYL